MKIILFENNYGTAGKRDRQSWFLLADSALSNRGKPFFMPDDVGIVTASASVAVRISRLGKSISPRFARRYYSQVAPVIHFQFPELKERCVREGLSFSEAVSFDKAMIHGIFMDFPENPDCLDMNLSLNGERVERWRHEDMSENIDVLISKFSEMNTMKMGDLIVPALSKGVEVKPGDRLMLENELFGSLTVKVK